MEQIFHIDQVIFTSDMLLLQTQKTRYRHIYIFKTTKTLCIERLETLKKIIENDEPITIS